MNDKRAGPQLTCRAPPAHVAAYPRQSSRGLPAGYALHRAGGDCSARSRFMSSITTTILRAASLLFISAILAERSATPRR